MCPNVLPMLWSKGMIYCRWCCWDLIRSYDWILIPSSDIFIHFIYIHFWPKEPMQNMQNLVIIVHLRVFGCSINASFTGSLTGRGGVSTLRWVNLLNGCGFVLSVFCVSSTNSSTLAYIFDKLFAVCFPANTQRELTLNTGTELLVDSFHYCWLPVLSAPEDWWFKWM